MRVEGGIAGEGRVVGLPKFHSWGKCTMSLTNINSDRMSNASSGLCIIGLIYYTRKCCGGEPEQAVSLMGEVMHQVNHPPTCISIYHSQGALKVFWFTNIVMAYNRICH